jgi:DHA1 family quinolone resistance protein-like MFS transporter
MTQIRFRLRANRPLTVLAGVQALVALSFYVPVSALFLTSRGLSYADIFLLETVLLGAILAVEIPTGALADRMDRKTVLVAGFGLATAGEILFAAGGGMGVYVVSFALHGASIAVLSGAQEAYVYELLGKDADEVSATAFGRLSAIELAAGVAASAVGSLLATVDLSLPAICAAVAHAAALLGACFLTPHRPVPTEEDEPRGDIMAAIRSVLTTPVLLYGAFAAGTGFILFNAVYTLNQPLFTQARLPVASFGVIVAAGLLLAALANNMIGWIEPRVGRGRLLVLATLVGSGGYALMTVPHPVLTVAGFGLVVIGMNLRAPILGAIVNRLIADAQRATVLSVMSSTGSLLGMALNPVLGHITNRSYPGAAFAAGGMLLVLGLAWIPVAARSLATGSEDTSAGLDTAVAGTTKRLEDSYGPPA